MFHDQCIVLAEAVSRKLFPTLEAFACPYDTADAQHTGVIRIIFPEFTCVCPRTGYPDFARIYFYYLPDRLCIELKSWKLYLNAFRMVGTFHETVTAHLFDTVINLLKPRWALLGGDFTPRGNVQTTVVFETPTPRPRGVENLLNTELFKERV